MPRVWRDRWPEALVGSVIVAGTVVILALPGWEALPFNLIWISTTILYGHRRWPPRVLALVLVATGLLTTAAVLISGAAAEVRVAEVAEIPVVCILFGVVIWHVQRADVLEHVNRAAARERDFVRDVSHQLRTPITIARGHAELIETDSPETEAARDARVVIAQLERLQRMSDRLLVLVCADHPDFLATEDAEVGSLVESAWERWSPVADREWGLDVSAWGTVPVDRPRIDDALDALIENAVKATVPGQRIVLRALARDGVAVLQVADDGPGVPAADRERIFERWGRSRTAHTAPRNGTGLGLPLARSVARAHGGTAELLNGASGPTTFELRLGRLERSA